MKKHIIFRNSLMVVAAASLFLGGVADVPDTSKAAEQKVKVVADKAIQTSLADVTMADKGSMEQTKDIAMETETVPQEIETKEAKVESNQIVANIDTFLNIRSEASEDSDVVGKFYNGNVGTLIEQGEEWSLVASGNAYGYVKNDYILSGAVAESYIENNCDQVAKVTTDTLNVRAEDSTDSDIVALSGEGEKLSVVGEEDGWVKVAVSEDLVGYVSSDYVCLDYAYDTAITIEEEEAIIAAEEEKIRAEEEANNSQNTTSNSTASNSTSTGSNSTSTGSGSTTSAQPAPQQPPAISDAPANSEAPSDSPTVSGLGQSIAQFACQFVGNPYVYGGTSLTNGADCSGFVMSVFANFGISLPRTSYAQSNVGYSVNISDLRPGDLLFYHGFGHVAIYIGNGQVVHASNAQTGIKISAYNYSNIDRAVRVVD
ncbi:MAG: NlpC/P60 family protein [Lachnospiraceae bacterium]